jgi:endonuclease/exonuclease/phosphatase family metal-dependent hydrolase
MSQIRFVVWNMEWLNDLFVAGAGPAQFRPDREKPLHAKGTTVGQRRAHLAGVLKELAPDIVVVVEGPSSRDELQLLFDADMPGQWKIELQDTPGQSQNIGIAVRTDTGKFAAEPLRRWDTKADREFDPFLLDTDGDDVKEQHKFDRRPLYVELLTAEGKALRVLGLHLKSKGIFDAYEWSRWWEKADANRKRILAQARHVRDRFLDPYLTDPATQGIPLIVCGDINDGPGLDASEKRLFGSGVERLMGDVWKPDLCLGNALYDSLSPKDKDELDFTSIYTTSFRDPIFNDTYQREWIDHILYSRIDHGRWISAGAVHRVLPSGPIWVKYKHASDHFPVSAELTL